MKKLSIPLVDISKLNRVTYTFALAFLMIGCSLTAQNWFTEAEISTENELLVTALEESPPSYFVGPNPTNGVLNISQTNPEIRITLIEVFDVQGRMIAQFENPQQQFSISELPSGLLFVRMTSTNTSTKERYLETKQIVSSN